MTQMKSQDLKLSLQKTSFIYSNVKDGLNDKKFIFQIYYFPVHTNVTSNQRQITTQIQVP